MKTSFDISRQEWLCRTTDYLPKHDLYFGTPVNSPMAGLPIGDGDTGSLIWLKRDGLHININKSDLWQDAPSGVTWDDECYCSGREEELTCVKHGGEIDISFGAPIFDYLYQKKFTARLSLSDASARITAKTPFACAEMTAFSESLSGVTAIRLDYASEDGGMPEITLSRWGSRTLWRWYSKQKFAPEVGLGGTESSAEGGRLYITQELNATKFCVGLSLAGGDAVSKCLNRHSARMDPALADNIVIYYTIKTGDTVGEAKRACEAALDAAKADGFDIMYDRHKAAWEEFWNRSYIRTADDYLDNIYYLYLYLMNSGSRGKYPPHFTSALWGFYHDYIPWVYYFHYNLQHLYAPLDSAGHGELAANYYELRRNGLPVYRLYAERVKKMPGVFVHDVTDRYGRGADYDSLNCTPASQIAMQMYRHWRYTGDDGFLRDYVLPMMKGAADFYLGMLKKDDNGVYHIEGTTAYEGNAPTDDTLTDIVMIRCLFTALKDHVSGEYKERLTGVLDHLPDTELLPLDTDDWDGDSFTFGIGKGRKPLGDKHVFGIGKRDGKPVRVSYGDPDSPKIQYGFPDIELSPLYPAGIFGLKDKNSPLFDNMTNQLMLHNPGNECGHWNMLPVYLARMGMADEFIPNCRGMLEANQGFLNGFNAESSEPGHPGGWPDWYNYTETDSGEKRRLRSYDFIHFDFETTPIISQGMNESLLQSHEGVIRLFPAVKRGDPAAFSLYAEGGFRITAELSGCDYAVTIENLRGESCLIAMPEWLDIEKAYLYLLADGRAVPQEKRLTYHGADKVISLPPAERKDVFLITSATASDLIACVPEKEKPNSQMKECGRAALGSPSLT